MSEPKSISMQEAQAVMEGERRRREAVCVAAITAALESNKCVLVPVMEVRGGSITHRLTVEAV